MDGRVTRLAPDVLPAAALLVLGEVEVALGDPSAPRWAIALLTVALTAPLALRRRAPLAVLIVTVVAMSALSAVDDSFSQAAVPLAIGVAVYSAGRHADATGAWFALALLLATFGAGALIAGQSANDFAIGALMFGGLWAFGRGLRARSERVDALTERAERLERERAEGERAAVAAERARIARELHDIVSHSISVVVVQTRAVRRRLDPGQERERDDLAGVETTARQAMGEMRRLFGVLRADGSEPSLAPQPGLDQLARLVEETRHAGVPVEVAVSGDAEALSPGVDLAAYRIVQEALTNVRKHAGEAQARVALRYGAGELAIDVEDDGARPHTNGRAPGHGLIGMRERVALYGGTVESGPLPAGGFRVSARLPIRERGSE